MNVYENNYDNLTNTQRTFNDESSQRSERINRLMKRTNGTRSRSLRPEKTRNIVLSGSNSQTNTLERQR